MVQAFYLPGKLYCSLPWYLKKEADDQEVTFPDDQI